MCENAQRKHIRENISKKFYKSPRLLFAFGEAARRKAGFPLADVRDLTEFLDAGFLTKYVDHRRPQRGGIMLVGPAGVLKSSIIKSALKPYPQALVLTDLNINTLSKMKDDLVSGRYHTLAFEEMQKLYERNPSTAKNIEGAIKAFVDQGFLHPAFADQRMVGLEARMMVIGAMTYSFYSLNYSGWRESGFARRFIWMFYRTSSYDIIGDAIEQNKDILLDGIPRLWPQDRMIPYDVTAAEAKWLRNALRDQVDDMTSQILLQKIYCVLKWKYKKEPGRARHIIEQIEPLLTKNGGEIDLVLEGSEPPKNENANTHNRKATRQGLRASGLRKHHKTTVVPSEKIRVSGLEAGSKLPGVSAIGLGDHPEKSSAPTGAERKVTT